MVVLALEVLDAGDLYHVAMRSYEPCHNVIANTPQQEEQLSRVAPSPHDHGSPSDSCQLKKLGWPWLHLKFGSPWSQAKGNGLGAFLPFES